MQGNHGKLCNLKVTNYSLTMQMDSPTTYMGSDTSIEKKNNKKYYTWEVAIDRRTV